MQEKSTGSLKLRGNPLFKRPCLFAALVISFLCALVMMAAFSYIDSRVNTAWSVELLDCIFRKTDMEFYEYSALNLRNAESPWETMACDKTVLIMLPLAIWNLPLWIIHEITGVMPVSGFGDVLWMKTGLLLCVVKTALECGKIAKTVNPDSDHMLIYPMIFASFDMLCSTMYFGQDEIVYLMFLAIALRHFVCGKLRRAIIFSTLAVSLNPELLIPVLMMILFYEKRVFIALLYTALTYIPSEAFNLIYRNNAIYHKNNWLDKVGDMMDELFSSDIAFVQDESRVSLFILSICIFLFLVYIWKDRESDSFRLVWAVAGIMTSMSLLSSGDFLSNSYRTLIYIPFLAVLIVVSKTDIRTGLLFYSLYSCVRSLQCISVSVVTMNMYYISFAGLIGREMPVFDDGMCVGRYYGKIIPLLCNYGLITALCLALAVFIFYINFKSGNKERFKTVKLSKDRLMLVYSLFVPVVLFACAWMLINPDIYDVTVRYGSSYIDYYENDLLDKSYRENDGIWFYTDAILYEDNYCLINGEDRDGVRYLYEGGQSFGPYTVLPSGDYRITLFGSNMDTAEFGCSYSNDGLLFAVPDSCILADDDMAVYTLSLETGLGNVEFHVNNFSDEVVSLESIRVERVG